MTKPKTILWILSLSFAALFFGGCASSNPVVQVPDQTKMGSFSVAVDYGPYLVAKNKAWFQEAFQSLKTAPQYTLFQSLPPINESFATGRVDAVFEAEPPAIIGKAAGIDIKIATVSCSLVQEILVPKKSAIKVVKDLRHKKIAVLAGTSSHYGLLKILGQSGLSSSDVEVIDMTPPDAKNAFETGRVAAWAVWPPWVEQEELSGFGRVLSGGDAVIYSIMAVRGDFARQNPAIVRAMVATVQRAKTYLQQNPAEAQQIVATELNVPLPVIQKAWPRHNWAAQISPDMIADIQAKADFLKQNNFIQHAVNVRDDLIDSSFSK